MNLLIDIFEKNCKGKKGDKIFISYESKSYKFREILNLINQTCNYFDKFNLNKGDKITLFLENSIEFIVLYFASMKFGLTVNPSPVYLSQLEACNNIQEIKPKLIFCSEKFDFLKKRKTLSKKIVIIKNQNFIDSIKKFNNRFKKKK